MSHSDASPLADGFGRREGGFSGWIFSSDFTNEMDEILSNWPGRKCRAWMPFISDPNGLIRFHPFH